MLLADRMKYVRVELKRKRKINAWMKSFSAIAHWEGGYNLLSVYLEVGSISRNHNFEQVG